MKIETKQMYVVNSHFFETEEKALKYIATQKEVLRKRKEEEALREEYKREEKKILAKIKKYEDEYYKTQREIANMAPKRDHFVSLALKDVNNKISEFNTQINKLQNAIKICRGSLQSHKRQALADFKNTPEMQSLLKKRKASAAGIDRNWNIRDEKLRYNPKYNGIR